MARVKLRCIMGCQGLKSSYQEKGLLFLNQAMTSIYVLKFILIFLIEPCFFKRKMSRQKFKYPENEKSF